MITRALVKHLHAMQEVPDDVVDRTRYLLLDYLGCLTAGLRTESAASVVALADDSPRGHALAMGAAAHSVELDDTHNGGSIHLGVVMFSAALPVAAANSLHDPVAFFDAVAAGYELAARLAMALQPKDHYARGFHPTSTCGVFGAAVTVAKLLRLSEDQMLDAVGIAGSMAAGSLEFLTEGAWTKRLHAGLAAQNGILAAELAARGFRGPSTIIEGRNGFLHGYTDAPRPELLLAGLGKSFAILETSIKPHACCRYKQGPIDALLQIRAKHHVDFRQVRRIEVSILEAGARLIAEPAERKYDPQSVVDAQFSMPFGAAIAIVHGRAGLNEYSEAGLQDARVRDLMRKVIMTRDATLEQNFPREWPARATVEMNSGDRYTVSIRHPLGDPANMLTWEELGEKFRSLGGSPELERIVREFADLSDLRAALPDLHQPLARVRASQ